MVFGWDIEKLSRCIKTSTLLVCGDSDLAVPVQTGYELHEMLINSNSPIIIKGGGHGMVFRKAKTIIKEIEKFFSKIYPSSIKLDS